MNSRMMKRGFKRAGIYLAAMFISSITPTADLLTIDGKWFSENVNFNRYIEIFSQSGSANDAGAQFVNSLKISILVSVSTVVLAILFGGVSAYAFARLRFKFKNTLLMATMFFQLLPSITLVIPLYVIGRKIGMIDQPMFLVVLYMSFTLPYVIWVLNGYYKTIPSDLEQAAQIDGCTWFTAYWRIVLPLAKPGLVAVGALSFLMCWDEFMYALIFMISTAGCIATVFPMLLALIFQKYIVTGLTAGGVKD